MAMLNNQMVYVLVDAYIYICITILYSALIHLFAGVCRAAKEANRKLREENQQNRQDICISVPLFACETWYLNGACYPIRQNVICNIFKKILMI